MEIYLVIVLAAVVLVGERHFLSGRKVSIFPTGLLRLLQRTPA